MYRVLHELDVKHIERSLDVFNFYNTSKARDEVGSLPFDGRTY